MKRLLAVAVLIAAISSAAGASTLLDHGWKFIKGDDAAYASPSFDDSSWREVTIPHDWGIECPFDQKLQGETGKLEWWGTAWYRYHLVLPFEGGGHEAFDTRGIFDPHYCLDFGGVMSGATVYVNGHKAGGRPYGYSSWRVEIGEYLNEGDNVIAVRVDNKPESSRWYPGGGIYRNVYLVKQAGADVAYNGVCITSEIYSDGSARVRVKTAIRNYSVPADLQITTTVKLPDSPIFGFGAESLEQRTTLKDAADGTALEQYFRIPKARLWSPETPALYPLEIKVQNVATGEFSIYHTLFGVREAHFSSEGFFLNGEKYFLKGVCLHHDSGALGAVWNEALWHRRLSQLKDMGCNAIRCSHNPPAPELLDMCDRMGFLVIDELTDTWTVPKKENGYATLFAEWAERDLVDMIHRDRNHPSVILWSIGNECGEQGYKDKWDIPQRLTDICHREDPSRMTTSGNDNLWASEQDYRHTIDVYGFNYKPHAYEAFHKANPDKPYTAAKRHPASVPVATIFSRCRTTRVRAGVKGLRIR